MAKKTISTIREILKKTYENLKEGEPVVYCAAIAFFTIFSLPAILIIIILIGTIFFSEDEIRNEIITQVEQNVDPEAGEQVAKVMEKAMDLPGQVWWIIVGIAVIIKSATMIFFILQKALNSIWKVEVKSDANFFKVTKQRSITLAIVAGLGLLLVISLLADAIINLFGDHLGFIWEQIPHIFTRIGAILFSLIMVYVFFVAILKALPDVKIPWKDALVGGGITTILFVIGKEVINLILNNLDLDGYYAAAGSLVIILLWVFYSSIILYLGAVLTKSYSQTQGREVPPKSIAFKYEMKKSDIENK
ncbi:YihY/virulence factor BrkB family protein [Pleomorphovibrio marinus]|uniref:YihY/virulence factor BrkB family protein n=1 Tax=Pleomorphovibrio marinus TaxID=2164132 RepID=UPI001300AF5E|nr:YihY/virulence factor BrkB family protein [Pleomorphovibrio marinus]